MKNFHPQQLQVVKMVIVLKCNKKELYTVVYKIKTHEDYPSLPDHQRLHVHLSVLF